MNLALSMNIPCQFDGQRYYVRVGSPLESFLAAAQCFEHLHLYLPVRDVARGQGTPLDIDGSRVTIHRVPYYYGEQGMLARFPVVVAGALRHALFLPKGVNAVGCDGPSVVGTILAWTAFLRRRPVFLLVRGNREASIKHLFPRGWRRWVFLSGFRMYNLATAPLVRLGMPVLTMGPAFASRYARGKSRPVLLRSLLDDRFWSRQLDPSRYGPGQPFRMLFVGRLSPEKGLGDALQALQILARDHGLDARLTLVGEGPAEAGLRAQVRQMGLAGRVTFEGYVPHNEALAAQYAAADLFVLPSYTEGLPLTLLEAMGMGTPALCTHVGDIPSLIQHRVNGWLTGPGDVPALAAAIQALAADAALRERLAQAAHATAADYRMSVQAPVLARELEQALGLGARSAKARPADAPIPEAGVGGRRDGKP